MRTCTLKRTGIPHRVLQKDLDVFEKARCVFEKAGYVFEKAGCVFERVRCVFERVRCVSSKLHHLFLKARHLFHVGQMKIPLTKSVFLLLPSSLHFNQIALSIRWLRMTTHPLILLSAVLFTFLHNLPSVISIVLHIF